jgi:UDP-GlcNAc:undecaprenyl-phosphate GlcNAc-1-phosphate transferase
MYYLLVAFCTTLLFLGALRRAAHSFGLVDRPSPRKTHSGEIPLVGGLAIGGAFLTACFVQGSPSMPFVMACIVILATGLFDDLNEFSARSKFIGQLTAAVIMTSWGDLYLFNLGNLFGAGEVVLGNWALPFTLFCVIGLTNALNMIDGLDGLAGGIGLIASGWLCLAGAIAVPGPQTGMLCILNAAIAAFLIFNMRHPWRTRAAVFLGDAGSMFLGFMLVWFAVSLTQASTHDLYPIAAVWILGIPIMDTVYLMVRRVIRGRSPFAPDRRHLHHTLIYLGLSETKTVWVLLAVSLVFGAIGFVGWYFRVPEYAMTYLFLAAFAAYCVFMQYWRVILPLFGIKPKRFAFRTPEPVLGVTK